MSERRAQPDSPCEYGRPGQYHLWLVYAHNAKWTVLECLCHRCAVRCTMSQDDYIAVREAAEREWQAFLDGRSNDRQSGSWVRRSH